MSENNSDNYKVLPKCNNFYNLLFLGCVDVWESKVLRAGAGAHFHSPILNNLTWNDVKNFVDQSETTFHIADNNLPDSIPHTGSAASDNSDRLGGAKTSEDLAIKIARTHRPQVDSRVYYEIDWTEPTALVIGGETHGLSLEAWSLCEKTYGHRVYIPMSKHIESLNNAMSASIIIFEAQRQVMEYRKSDVSS